MLTNSTEMRSDFLIIGGGIAGISAGARLSDLGSVQVLEAEQALGYHATGRSAAMFEKNYGNAVVRSLNRASEAYLKTEDGGVLSPRGILIVAAPREETYFEQHILTAGYAEISIQQALAKIPLLRAANIRRAAYEPASQDIDVDLLLQNFARKLRRGGGRITTAARVGRIARDGGLWRVETPAGVFRAPLLFNAAGAWADLTARMAGARPLGIQPYRRSAVRIPAPPGQDITGWPMVLSATENWYAKPDAGMLMVSPADADPVEPMDAFADDMVLAQGLDRFTQFLDMEITRVTSNWAGLRSFAPDKSLVIGFDPQLEGLFWIAGQGGYGVQTSPAVSQLVHDLVAGDRPALSHETVAALDPARFQGKKTAF